MGSFDLLVVASLAQDDRVVEAKWFFPAAEIVVLIVD
jgi:hypothetical protein